MVKSFAVVMVAVLLGTAATTPAQAAPSDVDMTALRDEVSLLAPPGSATRIDSKTGRVHVRVPLGAPIHASVLSHGNQVVIERTPGVIGTAAGIVGGHEIEGVIDSCTAGFMVRDSLNNRYALTAGHCTANGGNWRRNGKILGPTAGSVFGPEGDFGLIWVRYNYVPEPRVNSLVSGSLGIQPVVSLERVPLIGTNLLCKMGRTTRYTCGDVLAYEVTITVDTGFTIGGLIETNLCAGRGDSGGPLFTSSFVANPPFANAVGLTSAITSNIPCSHPSFRSYYQPVAEAINVWNLDLMRAF